MRATIYKCDEPITMGFYSTTCDDVRPRGAKTPYPRSADGVSGHRFYSPEIGRWVSRDPMGEDADKNIHVFCVNNPLGFCDCIGLVATTVLGSTRCSGCKQLVMEWDLLDQHIEIWWYPVVPSDKKWPSSDRTKGFIETVRHVQIMKCVDIFAVLLWSDAEIIISNSKWFPAPLIGYESDKRTITYYHWE